MTGDCTRLIEALEAERGALETLLFKLREQNLVLTSGEHRWLAPTTAEVEQAVKDLTAAGIRREAESAQVHAFYRLAPGANIATLADAVPDELTGQQLLLLQRQLRDVLDQVRRCSRQNREMLAQGLAATNDALALLGLVPTYDSAGSVARSAGRPLTSFDARV